MSFTERLRIILDVDGKGGTAALKSFGASIREADGFAGKFKAGASSAMQSVQANAGALATAGGAALIAFGVKAVAAFTGTAKAAVDMGKATGLSVEAASRWIAVADDYEISTESLQTAMMKAKRQGLDFADVLDTINKADPGDRAKVAFDLLGKSAAAVAPLLGKSRSEYEKMLKAVEKGQVITEQEAAKAERMRLAQDALSDALGELTLAFGAVVAESAPTIEAFADLTTKATDYLGVAKQIVDVGNPFGWASTGVEDILALEGGVISATVAADAFPPVFKSAAEVTVELGDASKETHIELLKLEEGETDAATAAANLARDIKAAHTAFTQWSDELDDDKSLIDLEIELRGAQEALEGLDPLEKESALLGFKQHIRDVAEGLDDIPEKVITDVVQSFDGANYESIIARLQTLQAIAAAGIHINVTTGAIVTTADAAERRIEAPKVKGKKAAGGPVTSGGAYLVGELGPEVVNIPGGSHVTPNNQLGGGVTNVSIAVNVGPGADPVSVGRATADALAAYYRNGGTRP